MCLNSTTSAGKVIGGQATDSNQAAEPELTVRQVMDARIANTRQHLEELVIRKAKADTAGLLDFPQRVISELAW